MVFKNSLKLTNRLSKLFQPFAATPKDAEIKRHEFTSKSQKLLLELGFIKQASPGCYHFLPLGVRSLDKLINLVDTEMQKIGGQKIIFPTLTNTKLWEMTGRLETVSSELFQVRDRHNQDYILSPTHEEAASDLLASIAPISYRHLPLRLYQITNKYRDEMKPRYGLMRGKQFLMKDMYSFDTDIESSKQTYDEICSSYDVVFKKIGVDFVKVLGSSGHMGGNLSHEYHYKAEIGEDKIRTCLDCNNAINTEISESERCLKCGSASTEISHGIEVGHTFLLGDKYSKPLKANYLSKDGKPKVLQMGSYGLGLSRILAAAVEVLSTEQEMRWPFSLAPFNVIILPPKAGSKEESHIDSSLVENLYSDINSIDVLQNNVLLDDRTALTIGRRLLEAKRVGYPLIVILGQKIAQEVPLFEINDLHNNKQLFLDQNSLLEYIKNVIRCQ